MVSDNLGMLNATENKSPWQRFTENYTPWVFLVLFTAFLPWAYVTTVGLPSLLFLAGLFLVGHLFVSKGSWRAHWPTLAATGALLVMAFVRSDFIDAVRQGVPLGEAYAHSKQYFIAPIVSWFVMAAIIFAARSLTEDQALRVFKWFVYILIALSVIQLFEAVSQFGLRRAFAPSFHSRDKMLIVGLSNTNCALLMMVWPLAMVQRARAQWLPVIIAVVAVLATAVTSDTNAHILAMAASLVVFFAARYWPKALSFKGLTPERFAAVVAAGLVLLFPVAIIQLIDSGLANKIKTELLPSWAARIDIWSYAVERSLEKPIGGWGYEAARQFEPIIPNHPHNMSLQAWLELGIPGLVVLAAFWFALFWNMGVKGGDSETPVLAANTLRGLDEAPVPVASESLAAQFRPYLMAQAVGYLVIGTLSYGLWRLWFDVLGGLAIAVAIIAIKAASCSIKLRN